MDFMSYVTYIWKMEYYETIKNPIFDKKKALSIARTKMVNFNKWIQNHCTFLADIVLNTFIYLYIQQILILCLIKHYVPDLCTVKRLRLINTKELIISM